jgi:hypothetical protein
MKDMTKVMERANDIIAILDKQKQMAEMQQEIYNMMIKVGLTNSSVKDIDTLLSWLHKISDNETFRYEVLEQLIKYDSDIAFNYFDHLYNYEYAKKQLPSYLLGVAFLKMVYDPDRIMSKVTLVNTNNKYKLGVTHPFSEDQIKYLYTVNGTYYREKFNMNIYDFLRFCLTFHNQITDDDRWQMAKLMNRIRDKKFLNNFIECTKLKMTSEMVGKLVG